MKKYSILFISLFFLISLGCDDTIEEKKCGNGILNDNEDCDVGVFSQPNCTQFDNYIDGTLICNLDNCTFDFSNCIEKEPQNCGNGIIDQGELCDGTKLNNRKCSDSGFKSGKLYCNANCNGFIKTACYDYPGICGNGVKELGESCDGSELGGFSCSELIYSGSWLGNPTYDGFVSGELKCNQDCTFNVSSCEGDLCAELDFYNDGYCDNCSDYGGFGDPDCERCDIQDGKCTDFVDFTKNISTCFLVKGEKDPDCGSCNDGVIDHFELCDSEKILNDLTCENIGFSGGTLSCGENCSSFDVSNCNPPVCGNGEIERAAGEVCDGTMSSDVDCTDIGYRGGELICLSNCSTFDESSCMQPVCGNELIESAGNELCDGTNYNNKLCNDFGYRGGELSCLENCLNFDFSNCIDPVCGNNIIESAGSEVCDGTDLGSMNCASLGTGFTEGELSCTENCSDFITSSCDSICHSKDNLIFDSTDIVINIPNICTEYPTNVFNPVANGCTGYEATGEELIYTLVVNPDETINIKYTSEMDGALYILKNCLDTLGETCIAGSDNALINQTEELNFTNSTTSDSTFYIIADHYSQDICDGTNIVSATIIITQGENPTSTR
jgi:hypothetical protein